MATIERTPKATVRLNAWELTAIKTALERWMDYGKYGEDTPLRISVNALLNKISKAVTK